MAGTRWLFGSELQRKEVIHDGGKDAEACRQAGTGEVGTDDVRLRLRLRICSSQEGELTR